MTNLLVASTSEHDSLPVRHAAFDIYLLPVLLLDSLVAFALFAPTTPYRSIMKGSWGKKTRPHTDPFPAAFRRAHRSLYTWPCGYPVFVHRAGDNGYDESDEEQITHCCCDHSPSLAIAFDARFGFRAPLGTGSLHKSTTEYI